MDIEEFYDADPRRRGSAEIELGRDWHDAGGLRYEISWVQDTGELYSMSEPVPPGWATPFGGVHAYGTHRTDEREVAAMTVAVIATVATREEVERLLAGWEEAMGRPDSVDWLVGRLRASGALVGPVPSPHSTP